MKKLLLFLMMSCLMIMTVACENFDGGVPNRESVDSQVLVISTIEENYTAELGERFDIPEVTANRGNKIVEVVVTVKTTAGEDVELQGRGTRFIADDIGGYVMTFVAEDGEDRIERNATVSVLDSQGPKISFAEAVDGMNVKLGETVAVPKPIWSDASGEVLDATYTVTFGGETVTVVEGEENDTFVADKYGDYVITYTAKDVLGNEGVYTVVIACSRSIVIEDFEAMDTVWADPSFATIVEENAVEGNALKVDCTNDWQLVAIYPTYYDLSGFDKFQITIYATASLDTTDQGFYILNQKYQISEGKNVITITKEEFQAQYPNGKIPSTVRPEYYEAKYIWCQVKGATGTLYIDNFIGIFENYETDTVAPVIDFGKDVTFDKITVNEGRSFVLPSATAYDNSMEEIAVTAVVTNKAGEDITESVIAGNYLVKGDEEYSITYTASDLAGNRAEKTVEVEIIPKAVIPDMSASAYFPADRQYDVLQDFENTGMSWTQIENSYESEHVLSGEKSLRLSTPNSDTCVVLTIVKNGQRLETADWEKYEYIKAYVYAENEGARFDFYLNTHNLEVGPNVITVTPAEIIAEIAKASNVYDALGGFFCQLTKGTVYIDSIIGVYPEGYVPGGDEEELERPDATKYYPADRLYDTLQSFDEAGCVDTYFFAGSEGITTANAVKEKAFRVQGDANWAKLPVMIKKDGALLTEQDWKAYESFKLSIFSETAGRFAFLNHVIDLSKGWNIVTISSAEMWAQISSNGDCYPESGMFFCQLVGNGLDLYFDELIGIYPEGYNPEGGEDPEEPEVPELPEAIQNYFPTDRAYDTLQSFDENTAIDPWSVPNSLGKTTENAIKGNAYRVIKSDAAWTMLQVVMLKNGEVLTEQDWKAYESFKLVIYSEGTATFAFLSKLYDLTQGWNIVTITSEEMWTQISSNANCYLASGHFWCQLNGNIDIYLDELIGIYPEGYNPEGGEDPEEPEVPELPEAIQNYFPTDRLYDVLQNFDTANSVDTCFFPNSEGVTTANAVKEKAFRVQGEANWSKLPVMILKNGQVLTEQDWKAYESF
ncbi:MAG: DUF5011 domain-containing protein, partial [Clostridiales bacterium]|nr:DUF5011 domain-containing protein [Clostridiales bacterium]